MSQREKLRQIHQAWQTYFAGGPLDRKVVRPEVANSWERCRTAGMRPDAPKAAVRLSNSQLEEIRSRNRRLISAAIPFLEFLQAAVRGTGFILVLTTAEGIVLELSGDDQILEMARENNYVPGCCRSEEEVGTNAIALCMLHKKPIQLTGPEHLNMRHHLWTCSSAPIFKPSGEFCGAITLSGNSSGSHPHTMGMVIAAAEAIQRKLSEAHLAKEKTRVDSFVDLLLDSLSEGVIEVDSGGKIRRFNKLACKYLRKTSEQMVDAPLSSVISALSNAREIFSDEAENSSIEVPVDSPGGRTFFMLRPMVIKNAGQIQGAVVLINERKKFFNMVRNVSGFQARFSFKDIVGNSPILARRMELAKIAAQADSRVLLLGETGTGKELFAQAIHNHSNRRDQPFVAINCAAIPRELIESEVFGHSEGAFTGSRRGGQAGKMELADGGTLFLDEVGELPLDMQAKLLRVLQDGYITRLGDSKPIRVNVRVIAATNENLHRKMKRKDFRKDLYFRLSVIEITLPPLRDRLEDIEPLSRHILERLSTGPELAKKLLSPTIQQKLKSHSWPGNVRELNNYLERAVVLGEEAAISMEGLWASSPAPKPVISTPPGEAPLSETEAMAIKRALRDCGGNVSRAARVLKVSRSTIYRRMRDLGINRHIRVGSG